MIRILQLVLTLRKKTGHTLMSEVSRKNRLGLLFHSMFTW